MTTKHNQTTQNKRYGFTLIELTIVITIIGLFIGAITSGLKAVVIKQQKMQTQTRIENIREALTDYVEINGRLPCPADPTIPIGIAGFGREAGPNCAAVPPETLPRIDGRIDPITTLPRKIRVGAVPVLALGLSFETMIDGSKNYFTYAVTEALTATPTFSVTEGAIEIVDLTGASMLSVPETALYTVFSHGRDGRGSYTASGVLNGAACDSEPGLDAENCDGDGVFRSAVLSRAEGAQFYDDSIEFSETILDSGGDDNTGPTCPLGVPGIPGIDELGIPTCYPPPVTAYSDPPMICGYALINYYSNPVQRIPKEDCLEESLVLSSNQLQCPIGHLLHFGNKNYNSGNTTGLYLQGVTCAPRAALRTVKARWERAGRSPCSCSDGSSTGTMTYNLICKLGTLTVSSSECAGSTKPQTVESCTCQTGTWVYGAWSPCMWRPNGACARNRAFSCSGDGGCVGSDLNNYEYCPSSDCP